MRRIFLFGGDHIGIGGLGADTVQPADFSRKGADHILRRVNSDADDVDAFFTVRDPHAAHDIRTVFVQDLIEVLDGIGIFYNDADNGDSGFHRRYPFF